jgi:hypothetical protein
LAGNAIKITDPNFIERKKSCFTELAAKLSDFCLLINRKEKARAADRETERETEMLNDFEINCICLSLGEPAF